MTDLTTHEFERILLIKPSALGDIIHALPVLHGLRTRYPQAHISWLVNEAYVPLLNRHPELDAVIPFDRQAFRTLRTIPGGVWRMPGWIRRLRDGRFDLALDLQGLFRSGLMALASGARTRLGFRPAREGAGLFYTHRIDAPDDGRHAVDRNYRTAAVLGFADVPIEFCLPVDADARQRVVDVGHGMGFDAAAPYVLVSPSSRWETKNWLPERFAATIDRIVDTAHLPVILCGSALERQLCSDIALACHTQPVNLAGRTDLPALVALIDGATAVLCNDSATSHLAMALGRPQVTLFGPTDPARTGPYGRDDSVLQAKVACSPCFLRRLRDCPHGLECMKRLEVDQVSAGISAAISRK